MNLTMKLLLVIYCWPVWIIVKANAACEDKLGPLLCGKRNCEAPGIANYCKKTCKVCINEGCGPGHYQLLDGSCSSCNNPPKVSTSSYNRSCYIPCSRGLWGPNCDFHCEEGCVDSICNRWTGNCDRGCKGCYRGFRCDSAFANCECLVDVCGCKKPYYGIICSEVCPYTCKLRTCNVTGDCVHVCRVGWYGKKCDSQCRNCRYGQCAKETTICDYGCKTGYYGSKCDKACHSRCADNVCDTVSGTCSKGCNQGSYGDRCYNDCPANCEKNTCIQTDGRCIGCKSGYFGDTCNKPCAVNCVNKTCRQDGTCEKGCTKGFYGKQCSNACSINCKTKECNEDSGKCRDGCTSGWYGDGCNKRCSVNCKLDSCIRSNGSCQGCMNGYKNSHCNISCSGNCTVCDQYEDMCSSCSSGWYGSTCTKHCSTCFENSCSSTGGYCLIGCKQGWYDHTCKIKCNNGCKDYMCNRTSGKCTEGCNSTTFGEFCNNTCSDHCKKRLCYTTLGNPTCAGGCEDSWWGDYCQQRCSLHCKRCDQYNGTCTDCARHRYGIDCELTAIPESEIRSMKRHQWILAVTAFVAILLVIIMLITRKQISSCITRSRAGIYISPVPYNEGDIPLQDIYFPSGASDHTYASIADEGESGNGGGQSNSSYEPVGQRQF